MPASRCDNCRKTFEDSELQPIKRIFERVAPGEPMPSGDCPECRALCHPVREARTGPLMTPDIKAAALAELEVIKGLIEQPDTDDLAYIRKTVREQMKALIDSLS